MERINTKIIKENYDDVLRVAHPIREGKVSINKLYKNAHFKSFFMIKSYPLRVGS